MPNATNSRVHDCKLTICICTRNRAKFIGATLESIIAQMTNECEIVVFDGASTDGTERVVSGYTGGFGNLRYFKQELNDGVDRGFDHAIELASGEYCWLMPDDDIMKPGAVARVLGAIRQQYSLVVVNVEYKDFEMSTKQNFDELEVDGSADCEFPQEDLDGLFRRCWRLIRYSGSIVIKREIWLARERERFYDTFWLDVAVVFQETLPGGAYFVATPCISVRMGNQSYLAHFFDIFYVNWPRVVSTLAISEVEKRNACPDEQWGRALPLLLGRAAGQYSAVEYRCHLRQRLRSRREKLCAALIAILPGSIVNSLFVLYYSLFRPHDGRAMLLLLSESRFNLRRKLKLAGLDTSNMNN